MYKFTFLLFLLIHSTSLYAQEYYVYVTAESDDEVSIIKFDGEKALEFKKIPVGVWPAENEGPHGITVDPNGKFWYLSLAHGNPYGTLYKYSTETNKVVGKTKLGLFPASMQISEITGLLYCVNFNLHGDMKPSSVSVVDPESMIEIKKITTGSMPHGSRLSANGLFHYSVAMMSDELFEIDAVSLKVNRILKLGNNNSSMEDKMHHSQIDHSMMNHANVKPTWVIPHPTNNKIYIAANGSNEIIEVDADSWSILNRFSTGNGPYNVEITPNGKLLVVTYKSDGTTAIWDIESKKELKVIKNTRKVSHGVAISSDSKFAFISVEGIGGEPGTVDVIDLKSFTKVSSVNIGKQAGGIAFWKISN
jgi:DNA-binding beta-propeller fold protein YncE|tara:strand:+ start:341 stop:1429 length:1089 start_codon:yes stop_codon:yes gene_type:complete